MGNPNKESCESPQQINEKLQKTTDEIDKAKNQLEELRLKTPKTEEDENKIKELESKLSELESKKVQIIKETQCLNEDLKVDRIFNLLKEGKLTHDLATEILESLDKAGKAKYFLLGALFASLNKRGISLVELKSNSIELKAGEQNTNNSLDIAGQGETGEYESLINAYLSSGKIKMSDINIALLYRTSSIGKYLKSPKNESEKNTSDYVESLLLKYGIRITGGKLSTFKFSEDKTTKDIEYTNLKAQFNENIKGLDAQGDKEFLLGYFNHIYNTGEKMDDGIVSNYKKNRSDTAKAMLDALSPTDRALAYALGLKSGDDVEDAMEKAKNDPFGALKDAIEKGGFAGILLGLLGAIFGGKGWGLAGLVGGTAIAGTPFGAKYAGEAYQAVIENVPKGFDWAIGKLGKGVDWSQTALERMDFWYEYSNVETVDKDGRKKQIVDCNFTHLRTKVLNERSSLTFKSGSLSDEQYEKLKSTVNEYYEEAKKKNSGDEAKMLNETKDMNIAEFIKYIEFEKEGKKGGKKEEKPASKFGDYNFGDGDNNNNNNNNNPNNGKKEEKPASKFGDYKF